MVKLIKKKDVAPVLSYDEKLQEETVAAIKAEAEEKAALARK